jgi:hypothetical protein
MLLAPFSVSDRSLPPAAPQQARASTTMSWLLLWSIGGGFLLLVPGLASNRVSGLSAPFWLVAAPVLNMLWLQRRRGLAALRQRLRRSRNRRTAH